MTEDGRGDPAELRSELSSLLCELHLSDRPRPPADLPPITALLPRLRDQLIGASPDSICALIGRLERLFLAADPDWLLSPGPAPQEEGWAGLVAGYASLVCALIGCAALPVGGDDGGPPPAYQGVPIRAALIGSALTALLEGWRGRGQGAPLAAVAPPTCVFAATHLQEQVWTNGASRAAARRLMGALLAAGGWTGPAHMLTGWTGPAHMLTGCTGPAHMLTGCTGPAHMLTGCTGPAHMLTGCTGPAHMLTGCTGPAHMLTGCTGPAHMLTGCTGPAHMLTGCTGPAHMLTGCTGPAHMLTGGEGSRGILGGVLDVLQPQLTQDSMYRCEASKLVFAWTLLQVTRPSVAPHLPRLLPPALLLSDHHQPENCMLGVRCLHHIVLHTPAADLRRFNRAQVLHQALLRHLYSPEPALIQLVLPCLLDLLPVLETPPSSLGPPSPRRKPCLHDDLLRLVLTHMEAEHKLGLRGAYAAALPPLIDRLGLGVCRHLRRLLPGLLGYLEVADPPEDQTRMEVLEALMRTTRAAWPRMRRWAEPVLRGLLRLLVDVSSDAGLTAAARQRLLERGAAGLRLLDACWPGRVRLLLQQVDHSCCSPQVARCLATV